MASKMSVAPMLRNLMLRSKMKWLRKVKVLSIKKPTASKLFKIAGQRSLGYTVCPGWLSVLNIAVCTCQSQTPYSFIVA